MQQEELKVLILEPVIMESTQPRLFRGVSALLVRAPGSHSGPPEGVKLLSLLYYHPVVNIFLTQAPRGLGDYVNAAHRRSLLLVGVLLADILSCR